MPGGPLQDYRVIDLAGPYGVLGTRVMAGLGADVIRIEPPGGDPLRRRLPLDATGTSTYWHQMAAGKKSVVVDLDSKAGRATFWTLLESADVLFESGQRARLEALGFGWDQISRRCPDLIYTTISPFGLEGPRASWLGGDLVAMAAGGLMYLCGDPDRAPLRVSVEQASAQVGLQAMVGTLVALRARKVGARGQRVDTSMQEAISNTLGNSQQSFVMEGTIFQRAGGGRATGGADNRLVWACADGYVAWGRNPASMGLLHQWMLDEGFEPGFDPVAWSQRPVAGPDAPTREETQALDERIAAFFRRFPKMYLYEEGQGRGAMMCPVSTVTDLLANRQLQHRGFFHQVSQPGLSAPLTQPGAPFKMSVSPWNVGPSPQVGEHTAAVAASHRPARQVAPSTAVESRDIFKGLKVVDFSWVGVGPMAAQVFALYGAEVIRVESASRLDTFRNGQPLAPGTGPNRSAYWANVNRDKLGMTLNLRHPKAREVVRRLVEHADVVTESFAPGFMHEIGMDYESLRTLNPRMIMISMSMEGQGGPHLGYKGFGLVLQATAGITGLTGWPDRPPVGTGVAYTDWFATHLAASAVMCAIEHRDRTGEGQYIDLSQLESTIWGLDDAIVRYSATGQVMTADGNRNERAAPHGVFRCAGEDRWCAISVLEDSEWEGLRAVMGDPAWARDPAFATFEGRKPREAEIEAGIAAWTAVLVADEVATRLQAAGVPAYPVNDARDVQHDPQLAARGHFWPIEHPVIGPMTWDAPAYRLSGTPAYPKAPAPLLGQHNEYVYREVLGFTEEEFVELMVQGVAG